MIYLASRSPQRALLLARDNIPFELVDVEHNESSIQHPNPQAMALERACHKAAAVTLADLPRAWEPEHCILAADTVTSLRGDVYGKPENDDTHQDTDLDDGKNILDELAQSHAQKVEDGEDDIRRIVCSIVM